MFGYWCFLASGCWEDFKRRSQLDARKDMLTGSMGRCSEIGKNLNVRNPLGSGNDTAGFLLSCFFWGGFASCNAHTHRCSSAAARPCGNAPQKEHMFPGTLQVMTWASVCSLQTRDLHCLALHVLLQDAGLGVSVRTVQLRAPVL